MTVPDDPRKGSARERFRNIISADKDETGTTETRKPVVMNLPPVGRQAPERPAEPAARDGGSGATTKRTGGFRIGPKFWTAGTILSITANLVLLVLLVSAWRGLSGMNPGGGGLTALYASLDQMDRSHIRASIPVQTVVSLNSSVPVKTSTNITLAKDVAIQGAHVTINTALFNIDAPAAVTLPAGTSLDVDLDMTLPMQGELPISVNVPVDIAVQDTELHGAIQGLKDALRPLICASSPLARLPDGTLVCH